MEHRGGGALRSDSARVASTTRYESCMRTRFALPRSIDLRPDLLAVRDQMDTSQCVAFSVACVKEYQEYIEHGMREYFSPQFVYDLRENSGDGMYLPNAMTILKNTGCATEREHPFRLPPSPGALQQAANYRIDRYAVVNSTQSLKQALVEQGPCIISFPVYNSGPRFWAGGNGNGAGHCVAVVGYDDDRRHFILRNSWGRLWGENGYTYYSYDDWGSHWEIYSSVDAVSETVDPSVVDDDTPAKKCTCVLL